MSLKINLLRFFPRRAKRVWASILQRIKLRRDSQTRRRFRSAIGRNLVYEGLEGRRVLAGYFDQIADDVSGPNGAMSKVTTGLRAVSSLASLPLLNKPMKDVAELTNILATFQGKLDTSLRSLGPTSAETAIRDEIFGALGPSGAKVLASKTNSDTVVPSDVVVTLSPTGVEISIDLGFSISFGAPVGLGVNSVPFKPDARQNASDGAFSVVLAYHNFNFGFQNAAPYFSTSAQDELEFKILGYLPTEMTVGLGFLQLTATDQTPEKTPDKADLSLNFTADIRPDFTIDNPQIGGAAHLRLGLESSFTAAGLPQFKTDFVFDWTISTSSSPLGSGWGSPTLAFNNVEMNIGSFLGNLVQPLAERAQDLLEPLQPIFNLMTTPIPVLDDLSAEFNGPVIDLVFMSKTLSAYPNFPRELLNVLNSAEALRQYSEIIDRLAGKTEDRWVPLGSFQISGPSGTSLLDAPLAALGNLGLSKWSSLIFSGGKLDLQGFKDAILKELPGGVGEQINRMFDVLTGEVAGNGLTIDLPVTRDPSGVAMAFLLGQQESDLVTATANFHIGIDKLIDLSPIPGLIVGLRASGSFTAYAKMGYDIKGLQQAIAPLYAGRNFDASKIMNGLWIDRNTRLQGDGAILVSAGVGLPDVVELTADGGLTSNLTMTLSTNTTADKIRPLAGELGSSLFRVIGSMDAKAQVTFKAGFEFLGEFVGIDKSWPFAEANIYRFDTDNVPVPPSMQPVPVTPPQLARYDAANRILTLNVGADAHLRGGGISDAINENYVIKRLSSGGLAVSAFGYVQKYAGPFDQVIAFMHDGNDRLQITDPSSSTYYIIDGGDDDDTINIDGNVKVYLSGGSGNDTLDAGSGRESIDVRGGPGQNNITIGDGLLQNVDPNTSINIDGGFFGRLKIDNTADKEGSDYYFFDDPNSTQWRLTVVSRGSNGPTTRVLNFPRMVVNLRAGSGDDNFFGWFPQFANVYAGSGNDHWDFSYQQLGIAPNLEYYMSYFGGPGQDTLTIDGTNDENLGYKVRSNPFSDGTTSIISWGSVSRPTQLLVQGLEDTTITTNRHSGVEVDSWSDGQLTINAAYAQFNADHYVTGNTTIRVINTPQLFFVDPSTTATQKGMGIDEFGPYLGNPIDYYQWPKTPETPIKSVEAKLRINYDSATTKVDFFGSLMTIEPSVMYSTRPWDFSFVGSLQAGVTNILKIAPPDPTNPNVASRDFDYRITSDTLTIGPLSIRAQYLTEYQLIGGQGKDTITIDSLPANVSAQINGGLGEDTLIVNQSSNVTGSDWLVREDRVLITDVLAISLTNIEEKHLLAGSGNDRFRLLGQFHDPLEIDGGRGSDRFDLGQPGSPATFAGPIRIDGSEGDDAFNWYAADNVFDQATFPASNPVKYPVNLIGGPGSNTLTIDDTRRSTSGTTYDIDPNRILGKQPGLRAWAEIDFVEMSGVSLKASDGDDTFNVHSISGDIDPAERFKILGGGGADTVTIPLFDYEGTPTLGGLLSIGGGPGADKVLVVSSANDPTNFVVGNRAGSTTLSEFYDYGIEIGVDGDVEQLDVSAGSANDIFNIESYQNFTTALSIKAGDGDDRVAITPSSGNLFSNVSKFADLNFEGGDGVDSFNLNNANSIVPALYLRKDSQLLANQLGTDYLLNLDAKQFESTVIGGGVNFDDFYVESLTSGEAIRLNGGPGFSRLNVGVQGRRTESIGGAINFDAGVGGGNLVVDNSASSIGARVHLESVVDGSLGSAPGDTLFGPGGSLRFANLTTDTSSGTGIALALGSGADTIFAAPQTLSPIFISGGDPNEGIGDKLSLALAGVENPNKLTFGTGAGKLTSTNRSDVSWTGIEELDLTYVAPTSFTVTNTLDSGPGSLRQAILDANATPNENGPDIIRFALPNVGVNTIQPHSQLPDITDPVVLDATTQPGYAGKPIVELDGSLAGRSNGLVILSGGTTVRGFVINRFAELSSITMIGAGGNLIQGNYLGTNVAGDATYSMTSPTVWGIVIYDSDSNVIGTDGDGVEDTLERNVISGHGGAGILFQGAGPEQLPDNNVIAGNYIGTSADGNSALSNRRMGVWVMESGTGNRIGTNLDGYSDLAERNVISANPEAGIYLGGGATLVAGNYIGTNAAGTAALSNGNGIRIEHSDNNLIGGTALGAGNLIAYNDNVGVSIGSGTGNSILGNAIFNNGEIGIDLNAPSDTSDRITPNDVSDSDSGPNNLQNYPTLTVAQSSGVRTIVGGSLQSAPRTTYRIEFFASSNTTGSQYGQAKSYLGFVMATTDASGFANFVTSFEQNTAADQIISSTATDPNGNTSEISASATVVANFPSNTVALNAPWDSSLYLVTSPTGTNLTATAIATPSATPPAGTVFPFGFLDFTVSGIAAGSSADVTITGLDISQITDYLKYGATPANPTSHWYNFLFGRATDSDSAAGTGMEIVNGNIVLHLIDGQRGDDDLVANGTVVDIGGPVQNAPPTAVDDTIRTNTNTALTINALANDSDSNGLNSQSVVVIRPAGRGTAAVNPNTGLITYTPNRNFTGLDSFTYQVQDNLGTLSNVATVFVTVDTPPIALNDTASTYKNVPLVIKVLANDRDSDGSIDATTVAVVRQPDNGTTSINSTTGAITYTPATNYTGSDSFTYRVKDNLGVYSNVATVVLTVIPTGWIRGKEYFDVTGNGLSTDDLALPGVRVYLDTNNNKAWNVGEPSMITLSDGSYEFPDLVAGNYVVRQVTPAGYVRTAPTVTDFYSFNLSAGQSINTGNFANATLGNLNVLSNVVYVINGTKPVTDLRGNTKEGNTVQVSFTVVAGAPPQRFTLVSYTALSSEFSTKSAAQQKIFDTDTGVFGPGTYTLTVSNPHSYFQIDFVSGYAIDRLGPANSNIFYTAQNRLFSADNGGTRPVLTNPASIRGTVYRDTNNNGVIDSGETPIAGVTVTASSSSMSQTVVTDAYGVYTFDNLLAGTYTIRETQPADYTDGKDTLGDKGGTLANDYFSGIRLAAGGVGSGYNFGEQQTVGSTVAGNQTQTAAWWNSSVGQTLIKALNGGSSSKNLGNWLASNLGNLFGSSASSVNNLTGKTNNQVATYVQSLFASSSRKLEVEVLALALSTYVTNSNLAGTTASASTYGFAVSPTGLGASTYNVGTSGAALGIKDNTPLTVKELLSRINTRSRNGKVWDMNCDGNLNSAEVILANQVSLVVSTINSTP